MGINEVKVAIKDKFGSITKFCQLAGIDWQDLNRFFSAAAKKMTPEREKYLAALAGLVRTTRVRAVETEMDTKLRKKIMAAVEEYGGATYFCQENPQFNATSLRHIMNGRRKKINGTVRDLLKTLNIKIDGDTKPTATNA